MRFLLFLCLGYAVVGICKAVKTHVFFDISIKGKPLGRVEFELFNDIVPKTVNNFLYFCRKPEGEGYKGSRFHRVVKNQFIQGGDFINGDGTGEASAYGALFEDESFAVNYNEFKYILAMANKGPGTNASQFFISLNYVSWLKGRNVAFGWVVSGHEILFKIGKVSVNEKYRPYDDVIISNCTDNEYK